MHVKTFGTIISLIYLILSTIAKLFWCGVWLVPARTASLSSFRPMTNLHSAAFWEFLPCCSFGPICFFSLPSANPEPDNHQASCHSSSFWNAQKIAQPWNFCGLMCCCASAWWDAMHLFLFSFRLLWYATSVDQAMKNTNAWKSWRIALVLRISSHRCFTPLPFYASEAFVWALLQQSRPK